MHLLTTEQIQLVSVLNILRLNVHVCIPLASALVQAPNSLLELIPFSGPLFFHQDYLTPLQNPRLRWLLNSVLHQITAVRFWCAARPAVEVLFLVVGSQQGSVAASLRGCLSPVFLVLLVPCVQTGAVVLPAAYWRQGCSVIMVNQLLRAG